MANRTYAYNHALELVKAAISSNAIKLRGPTPGGNEAALEVDSNYLNGLINAIAQNLMDRSKD